jgi:hypothetical protein
MNRTYFLRTLAKHFYPTLRAAGFVGSGSTLRRINGPVVHVFNVQGSVYGRVFFINLGATLTFLDVHGLNDATVKTARESQCILRHRLSSRGDPRREWQYGATATAAELEVDDVGAAWEVEGKKWFSQYTSYPEDFRTLIFAPTVLQSHPEQLLFLAKIAIHLDEQAKAHALLREALARCPEAAPGLRKDLVQLLGTLSAA